MTRTVTRLALIGGLIAGSLGLAADGALAQSKRGPECKTYVNAKHGFALTYPTDEFTPLPMATPDGFQAVSKDGKARLLVGTIANFDGKSLEEYRTFLIGASYAGAKIDYAPVRATWFVLTAPRPTAPRPSTSASTSCAAAAPSTAGPSSSRSMRSTCTPTSSSRCTRTTASATATATR